MSYGPVLDEDEKIERFLLQKKKFRLPKEKIKITIEGTEEYLQLFSSFRSKTLKYLYLNKYSLHFSGSLDDMFPNLVALDLSFNFLDEFPPITNLLSLRYLNLSDNLLTTETRLITLNNLEYLDLSDNLDLSDIPFSVDRTKLKCIDLTRTKITDVSNLPHTLIHISGKYIHKNLAENLPFGKKFPSFEQFIRFFEKLPSSTRQAMNTSSALYKRRPPNTFYPTTLRRYRESPVSHYHVECRNLEDYITREDFSQGAEEYKENQRVIILDEGKGRKGHCYDQLSLYRALLSTPMYGPYPPEPGKPFKNRYFKLPYPAYWINLEGLDLILNGWKVLRLKKLREEPVGTAFGISQLHGAIEPIYSLIKVNSKYQGKNQITIELYFDENWNVLQETFKRARIYNK